MMTSIQLGVLIQRIILFIVSDAYGFNQAVTTIDSTLPAPVPAPIVVPSDASPLRVSARSNKNVNRYLSDEYYTSKDTRKPRAVCFE